MDVLGVGCQDLEDFGIRKGFAIGVLHVLDLSVNMSKPLNQLERVLHFDDFLAAEHAGMYDRSLDLLLPHHGIGRDGLSERPSTVVRSLVKGSAPEFLLHARVSPSPPSKEGDFGPDSSFALQLRVEQA